MTISKKTWDDYVAALKRVNETAYHTMLKRIRAMGGVPTTYEGIQELIRIANGISTKYGEAAAALAAEMYDALAVATGASVAAAVPAEVATYAEVAAAVNETCKSGNAETVSSAVERLVKMAGQDTTLQNAVRDGAEWAWIPSGETCAFCLSLASRGWQSAGENTLKDNHARHIHANCNCAFAIRFDDSTFAGYDPAKYESMYYGAGGTNSQTRINSLRRELYAENRDEINAQKRAAYAARKERER